MNESLGTFTSIPLSEIRLDLQTVTADAAPDAAGDAPTVGALYAGGGRRWFAVGAADGVQLVDVLGLHWPVDVVTRQWGPLDRVAP